MQAWEFPKTLVTSEFQGILSSEQMLLKETYPALDPKAHTSTFSYIIQEEDSTFSYFLCVVRSRATLILSGYEFVELVSVHEVGKRLVFPEDREAFEVALDKYLGDYTT